MINKVGVSMSEIVVIGLGPGRRKHLTREAQKYLESGRPLYLRTGKNPVGRYYAGRKKTRVFDGLYEQGKRFDEVYRTIIRELLRAVRKHKRICYAVPGHPLTGEETVKKLIRLASGLGIRVKIVPGMSFVAPLLSALEIDLLDGVRVVDALAVNRLKEPSSDHLVLAQVHSRLIASRIKLKLLELYPANYPVTVVRAAGTRQERLWSGPLFNLDRFRVFDHYATIYLPPYRGYLVGDLLEIMARLRSENGCPWDRQQTNRSLRQYLVEEAYEVVGAIEENDDSALKEELGDVLLQVVFHSRIASEENRFDFFQVTDGIASKLIRRHPHVFGSGSAADASEVRLKWEEIKLHEKSSLNKKQAKNNGPDINIDHSLPALLKAYKLQKKAADVGFDWPCIQGPLEKTREELRELEEAYEAGDQSAVEEELGDYLFTIVNLARFMNVNPELALGRTIGKFMERFLYVLKMAEKTGRPAAEYSLEQLDKWWEEAKKIRKTGK